MDIELRNDRIPRNPFDRQFLDMRRLVTLHVNFGLYIGLNGCSLKSAQNLHSGSAVRIRAARIPAVITPDVKTAKRGYAVMVTLGRTIDILKRWHTDKSHACNEK